MISLQSSDEISSIIQIKLLNSFLPGYSVSSLTQIRLLNSSLPGYSVSSLAQIRLLNSFLPGYSVSLNAELGRLCPFSVPRGHTFSTCPPRFSSRVFHGQIFTSDKHKVSAPGPMPSSKIFAPEKIEETWKNWLSTHYYYTIYTRPSK